MSQNKDRQKNNDRDSLRDQLAYLKLQFIQDHFENLAQQAASAPWSHVEFLSPLVEGEAALRQNHATERRIR